MMKFKFLVVLVACLFGGLAVWAQEDSPAQPVGGNSAFEEYLQEKMQYPEQAQKMGIEGNVFAVFDVDEEGKLTDIMITKGIGAGCDEEALRLLENAPAWQPAMRDGKPVRQRKSTLIRFRLP